MSFGQKKITIGIRRIDDNRFFQATQCFSWIAGIEQLSPFLREPKRRSPLGRYPWRNLGEQRTVVRQRLPDSLRRRTRFTDVGVFRWFFSAGRRHGSLVLYVFSPILHLLSPRLLS